MCTLFFYVIFFQTASYSHLKFYSQQHLALLEGYGENMLIMCSSAFPFLINEMKHNLIDYFIPFSLDHFHNCYLII